MTRPYKTIDCENDPDDPWNDPECNIVLARKLRCEKFGIPYMSSE